MIDQDYTNKLFDRWLMLSDSERNSMFSGMYGRIERLEQLTQQDYFELLDHYITLIENKRTVTNC